MAPTVTARGRSPGASGFRARRASSSFMRPRAYLRGAGSAAGGGVAAGLGAGRGPRVLRRFRFVAIGRADVSGAERFL
jgi:hypothetical protein